MIKSHNSKHLCTITRMIIAMIAFFGCFILKSVQKCNRTSHAQKRATRTHIAHTVSNLFRTHFRTHIARAHRNPTSGEVSPEKQGKIKCVSRIYIKIISDLIKEKFVNGNPLGRAVFSIVSRLITNLNVKFCSIKMTHGMTHV